MSVDFEVDVNGLEDTISRLDRLQDKGINAICQDLDTWEIKQDHYQLIINIRFLDRRLFPMIEKGLKSGGVLIFESYVDENRDYCLKPNELLHAFSSLHIVCYEERENEPSNRFKKSVYMVAKKQTEHYDDQPGMQKP